MEQYKKCHTQSKWRNYGEWRKKVYGINYNKLGAKLVPFKCIEVSNHE